MSDLFVYRSRDPEVVAAITKAGDAVDAYVRATQEALDAAGVGNYRTWRASSSWSPGQFSGLDIPPGESPPHGWRMNSRYAVPDKRTKAGKQAAYTLNAIRHPGSPLFKLIGMPPDVETPGGFITAGMRVLEGGRCVYVTWRTDPAKCSCSFSAGKFEIDWGRWERVPLSEYYAAVEARDAERAGTVPS